MMLVDYELSKFLMGFFYVLTCTTTIKLLLRRTLILFIRYSALGGNCFRRSFMGLSPDLPPLGGRPLIFCNSPY